MNPSEFQPHTHTLRCHLQLRVRAALTPQVVSAVEALEAQPDMQLQNPTLTRCDAHSQLKVRAALMPEVVSAVEVLEAQPEIHSRNLQ